MERSQQRSVGRDLVFLSVRSVRDEDVHGKEHLSVFDMVAIATEFGAQRHLWGPSASDFGCVGGSDVSNVPSADIRDAAPNLDSIGVGGIVPLAVKFEVGMARALGKRAICRSGEIGAGVCAELRSCDGGVVCACHDDHSFLAGCGAVGDIGRGPAWDWVVVEVIKKSLTNFRRARFAAFPANEPVQPSHRSNLHQAMVQAYRAHLQVVSPETKGAA